MSTPCWVPGMSSLTTTCLPSKNWLRLAAFWALIAGTRHNKRRKRTGFFIGWLPSEFCLVLKKLQMKKVCSAMADCEFVYCRDWIKGSKALEHGTLLELWDAH